MRRYFNIYGFFKHVQNEIEMIMYHVQNEIEMIMYHQIINKSNGLPKTLEKLKKILTDNYYKT